MSALSSPLIASTPNFRDFGGYATRTGGRVKEQRLFRSSQFSRLSEEEFNLLTPLSIAEVVDMRSQSERDAQPTPFQLGAAADHVSLRPNTDFIFNEIFAEAAPSEKAWKSAFTDFYRRLPDLYAPELSVMFRLLSQGKVPMIIHCSAGKDRTGVAAALILDLLGVDRDTIVHDYLASSARLNSDAHFRNMFTEAKLERYANLPPECRQVMLGTNPDFLLAALNHLDEAYGSSSKFVTSRLGLTEDEVEQIKLHLVS